MIYRFLTFLFLALGLSCTSTSSPQGILDESLMASILVDIQLAEGKVSSLPISYDKMDRIYARVIDSLVVLETKSKTKE